MCMLGDKITKVDIIPQDKPIYAWKLVRVVGPERFVPLVSANYPDDGWERFETYSAHTKPRKDAQSRTGFHAVKSPSRVLIGGTRKGTMLVPVKLWGKVITHDNSGHSKYAGYRAEFMEIL